MKTKTNPWSIIKMRYFSPPPLLISAYHFFIDLFMYFIASMFTAKLKVLVKTSLKGFYI